MIPRAGESPSEIYILVQPAGENGRDGWIATVISKIHPGRAWPTGKITKTYLEAASMAEERYPGVKIIVAPPVKVKRGSKTRRRGLALRDPNGGAGSDEFIAELGSLLHLRGRQIYSKNESSLGGLRYDTIFINFYNLPEGVGKAGGGAEAENNRMLFSVKGFGKATPHSPPPTGKVKIEQIVSAFPRSYSLRGRTGTPSAIAKYLATYLNKFVTEVPPRFTHSDH